MKSPAFQFYPKDFLSDANTIMMNAEVTGYYIRLISVDWIEDGFRPEDMGRLMRYEAIDLEGKMRPESTYNSIIAQLSKCFIAHPTKPSLITHPRLQFERTRQAENRKIRVSAGRKGAQRRWKDNKTKYLDAIAQPSIENGSAMCLPMAKNSLSSSIASSSTYIHTPNGVCTPIVPKTRISKTKEPIEITYPPTWSESHIETFKRWMEYRTQIRKPLKAMSYQAQLQKFSDNPDQLTKLIIRAIEKAWQGLNEEIPFEYKPSFVDNEKSRVEKNLEFAKNYLKELEDEEKNSH